jgi:MinD-like ATPase involved in chromosome partitioning or flagellar assembly
MRFDDALPEFARLVQQSWGSAALAENLFLRDVTGRLTLVVLNQQISATVRATLATQIAASLGDYVDSDGLAVATPTELFDERLQDLSQARTVQLNAQAFTGLVLLVDRRLVGADWLRNVAPKAAPPLRLVFASIKGGVGRTTALCVVAAHLATQGCRVLAIDMDLEAPGLGNMLLPAATLPTYGLLDYLVERNLSAPDDQFYADMVGASWLGGGRGRVDVIPALGQRCLANPVNVLAKIARAYLDGGAIAGTDDVGAEPPSFMDHMRALINRLDDPLRYDIILIDARAGLHESTATAVLGLGAEVLLFGLDQPQTLAGYELLFAHLATLPVDTADDWHQRFQFIQAKATGDSAQRDKFAQKVTALLGKYTDVKTPDTMDTIDITPLKDGFEVEWDTAGKAVLTGLTDDDITNPIIVIPNDSRYASFDPLTDQDALSERIYAATFGDLIAVVKAMLDNTVATAAQP